MKQAHSFVCVCAVALFLFGCSDRGTPVPMGTPDTGAMVDGGGGVDVPVVMAGCDNGVRDGDETHRDCGGSCSPCADGNGCTRGSDCTSMSCGDGFCLVASCEDAVMNGNEVGIDCGGSVCKGCEGGAACLDPRDCLSGVCGDGLCASVSCMDEMLNGTETDIDCGGRICPGCAGMQACLRLEDCESRSCVAEVCTTPTCEDRILNNGETAIDCGGDNCSPCPGGSGCVDSDDCISNRCIDMICVEPNCGDLIMNQDETDADCGGTMCIARCTPGLMCLVASDCDSGVCDAVTMLCQAPTCEDGLMNGDETEPDCGGATCMPCPTCTDAILNLDETDVDCGGLMCEPRCDTAEMCLVGADCESGICDAVTMLCQAPTCTDGLANGLETGPDCGGPTTCPRCADFVRCDAPTDCVTAMCTMGFCGDTGCIPFPGTPTDSFGYFGCSLPSGADTVCPDISTTGTDISLTDDDYESVPVGFTFSFYGTDYTMIDIQSNGTLTFRGSYHSLSNICLPSTTTSPDRYIAVYHDDLDPGNSGSGSTIKYETLGAAPNRQFVVRWDTEAFPSSPTRGVFVAVVNEGSNDVQVCYVNTIFGVATADDGIEATAGIHGPSAGLQFSCNTADILTDTVIRYIAP